MNLSNALKNINATVNEPITKPKDLSKEYHIKAFIITLLNDSASMIGARKCIQSIKDTGSMIAPFIVDASTPTTMRQDLNYVYDTQTARSIQYTWPIDSKDDGLDFKTGLYKKTYKAADWKRVMACSVSHMKLWKTCVDINEPIMILEHDAIFNACFKLRHLTDNGFKNHICGINDPIGATRKWKVFRTKALENNHKGMYTCPTVDELGDVPLPQGLAGNSAYVISPFCAKQLLDKVKEIGIWPNDAVMCKQLFPWLQIMVPFYTTLQGIKSTTTG